MFCARCFSCWQAGSQPQGGEGDSHGGDSSSQEESSPEENGRWEFDLPENHDMDPQRLQLLHEALADSSVYAMVTAKDGVIVDEFYQTVMMKPAFSRCTPVPNPLLGPLWA